MHVALCGDIQTLYKTLPTYARHLHVLAHVHCVWMHVSPYSPTRAIAMSWTSGMVWAEQYCQVVIHMKGSTAVENVMERYAQQCLLSLQSHMHNQYPVSWRNMFHAVLVLGTFVQTDSVAWEFSAISRFELDSTACTPSTHNLLPGKCMPEALMVLLIHVCVPIASHASLFPFLISVHRECTVSRKVENTRESTWTIKSMEKASSCIRTAHPIRVRCKTTGTPYLHQKVSLQTYPETSVSWAWYSGREIMWQPGNLKIVTQCVVLSCAWHTGRWMNNEQNGQGTYRYNNGDLYEGEWQAGEKHGRGTYTYADGTKVRLVTSFIIIVSMLWHSMA